MVTSLEYNIVFTKEALEDLPKLKAAKLSYRVQQICKVLVENPTPNYSKKLQGKLKDKRSIRINIKHRSLYEIIEDKKIIRVLRMWSHY